MKTVKHIVFLFLASLAFAAFPLRAEARIMTIDGIEWTFIETEKDWTITKAVRRNPHYHPNSPPGYPKFLDLGDVTIPSCFTAIGRSAFVDSTNLTSVVIPSSVKSIGDLAFRQCLQLTSVTIPNSVTNIGEQAFYHCGLTKITIPESVTNVGKSAFAWCFGLKTATIVGNGATRISDFEFYDCNALESIDIDEGVTSIGERAFAFCYNIKSVAIRNGRLTMDDIASDAFQDSNKIKDVFVPGNIRLSTLFPNSYLYITNVVVAPGKTKIGVGYYYEGCRGLRSISFPAGVTTIGGSFEWKPTSISIVVPENSTAQNVFPNEYQRVTAASLPPDATTVNASAFSGCTALSSISIPDSVTSIGREAFKDCSALSSIAIPSGVSSIGVDAFSGCSGLTEISISDSATWCGISFANHYSNPARMAGKLFSNGEEIVGLFVPGTVTSVGNYAFCGCTNLTSVSIENGVSSIGEFAFSKPFVDRWGLLISFSSSKLASVSLPNSVTAIATNSFWGCNNIRNVVVPGRFNIRTIFPDAYESITSVVVAPGSTSLGSSAFSACSGVMSVTIPDSMENIAAGAFSDCPGLATISVPASLQGQVQTWNLPSTCQVIVRPQGTGMIVFDSAGGSTVEPIVAAVGASLTAPATPTKAGWIFAGWSPAFPATMPGGGALLLALWTKTSTITFDSAGGSPVSPVSAVVGSPITAPAAPVRSGYTFAGWSPAFPQTMPEHGATLVAQWTPRNYTITFDSADGSQVAPIAAAYGSALTSPVNPTKPGYSFAGWSPAFPATMPLNGAKLKAQWSVDASFFKWTVSGNDVTVTGLNGTPVGVLDIPSAFDGKTVVGIGSNAFRGCAGLTAVTIPDGVTNVGEDAFTGCSGLSTPVYNQSTTTLWHVPETRSGSFSIPSVVTKIGNNAFRNCSGLTSITIPDSVTSVGEDAFSGCTGLENPLYNLSGTTLWHVPGNTTGFYFISEGVTTVGENAFGNCSGLTAVSIPDEVESVGNNAFSGCFELKAVVVPKALAGTTNSWGLPAGCRIIVGHEVEIEQIRIPVEWLFDRIPETLGATHYDCESAAIAMAANGANQVWECYVAGLDPSDPEQRFLAEIFLDGNGNPEVVWTPDLGDVRAYALEGKAALEDEWGAPNGDCRFFRVRVAMPGDFGNATIMFDSAGGSAIASITAAVGAALAAPVDPTRNGFRFDGWSPAFPATMPLGGATLVAQWTKTPAITFDSAGGSAVASIIAEVGAPLRVPAAPTKAGYYFAGWIPSFPQTMPEQGATLVAQWTPRNYTITFDSANGSSVAPITAAYGSVLAEPEPPKRSGYVFIGWSPAFPATMPVDGASLKAQWMSYSSFFDVLVSVPGEHATILGVNVNPTGALDIPDKIDGTPVRAIGDLDESSYPVLPDLTSITIPDSVRFVERNAFKGCLNLAEISIPVSLQGQTSSWGLPATCRIVVRQQERTITFDPAGGSAVAPITATVGTALTEPDPPTRTGFLFTGWLPAFPATMPSDSQTLVAQWLSEADYFTWTISGNSVTITGVNGTPSGSLSVPSAINGKPVTGIGAEAFKNCAELASVSIPTGVTSIGDFAFYCCSGLVSIEIPIGVTNIGEYAFSGCSGARYISIPAGVTAIGQGAFGACYAVEEITIPAGVEDIRDWAFCNCPKLASVLIPNGVTNIGYKAFCECRRLTSVVVPGSAATIGEEAFSNCSGLTSVEIENGVTSIGSLAFAGCSGMAAITIPDSVSTIGDAAFAGCNDLATISIPASLQNQVPNWRIPSTCQVVVRGVQSYTVTFDSAGGSEVPPITAGVGTPLTAPAAPTKQGYIFTGWSPAFPETMPVGGATLVAQWAEVDVGDFKWSLSGNEVTITGINGTPTGVLEIPSAVGPYPVTTIGWRSFRDQSALTSVVIPDSVETIGSTAFSSCSGLTSVSMGNGVTSIGGSAFYGCSNLISASIPSSVTNIGNSAFYNCSSLTSVTIPSGVESIGHDMFRNCSGLTLLTIGDGVMNIGNEAFRGCSKLTSVTIPNSVTNIAGYAFRDCSGLSSVSIGNGVKNIGDQAFCYCSGITSITIGNSVTTIGSYAFYGCSKVTSIRIPDDVTSIGNYAFSGCSKLTSLSLPGRFRGNTSSMGIPSGCTVTFRD